MGVHDTPLFVMKISEQQFLDHVRQRCEDDFEFFARYMFKCTKGVKYKFSYHLHEITKALVRVWKGETTHLIINMPPRYGKTELVVKLFVSWCYAHNPSCEFIHLSYSDLLAMDNSSAIKNTILSKEFQQLWPIELTKESDGAWKTAQGGVFLARSSGGQVTGYGAGKVDDFNNGHGFGGCLLVDDPNKPDDALSDVKRNSVNRRWDETLKSRLNSTRTPVIVIMQRLHEDDFCGMLLRDAEYKFEQLILPAILEEGTDNERALWPEKHSLEQLKAMQAKNSYMFAGQMQQRPTPLGGGIIKSAWFGFYDVLPKIKYRAIFVDTAQKEKESNDYQVASLWGLGEDGNLYLIDMMRDRFQAYELEVRIPAFWNKAKADRTSPLRFMGVEDKASGTQLIQNIRHKIRPAIPLKEIERSRSKLERVMDVQGYIESGYVKLPRNASFLIDFISECEAFTANDSHPHDDQIDTMCDAITMMLAKKHALYSDVEW